MTVLQKSSVNVFSPSSTTPSPFLISLSLRPYHQDAKSKKEKNSSQVGISHVINCSSLKTNKNYMTPSKKKIYLVTKEFMPSFPSYFSNSNTYRNFNVQEFSTQSTDRGNISSVKNTSNYPKEKADETEISSHPQAKKIQVLSSPKIYAEKEQMEQFMKRLLNTNIDDIESKLLSLNVMECTKAIYWWSSFSSNIIDRFPSSSHEAMENAETILNKLIQNQLKNPSVKILTLEHFHAVLDGWRRYALLQGKNASSIHSETTQPSSSLQSIAERCDSLLLNLETLATKNGASFTHPDYKTYNLVMDIHAKNGNYKAAEILLERMKKISSSSSSYPTNCRPDTFTYNILLSAYANHNSEVNDANAPYKAEELLQEMFVLSEFNHEIQPNTISFATVLSAWSNHAHILGTVAATRAQYMLDYMHEISSSSTHEGYTDNAILPDIICYTAVMNAWAKSGDSDSTIKVRSLLEKIHENGQFHPSKNKLMNFKAHDKTSLPVGKDIKNTSSLENMMVPNTTTFTTLIDAYARSLSEDAGEAAEEILRHMQELAQNSNNGINIQPNTITYNAVMNAHSKSRQWDSGLKAQALLDEMLNNQSLLTLPDVYSYATLIDAWANSSHPKRGEEAEKVLFGLLGSIHDNNDQEVIERKVQKQDNYLMNSSNKNRMIFPNIVCFTSTINAWATLGNPKRAERILDKMFNYATIATRAVGETANRNSVYNMNLFTNDEIVRAWNVVLKAHAKIGGAREAQKLLDKMKTCELVPDEISYTTVMDAWAQQSSSNKDAAIKCEEVLKRMSQDNLNPSVFAYNTVLNAFAKSQREDSIKKALSILEEIENLYDKTKDLNIKPNTVSFNTVISALAGSGDAHSAEKLLYRMQEIYMNEKDVISNQTQMVKPDIFSYSSVISAWSKSDFPGAAERAESILNHMQKLSSEIPEVAPNTVTYSSVLLAWAKRGDAKKCQDIVDHMEQLHAAGNKHVLPNNIVYNTLINCWAKIGTEKGVIEAEHILWKMQDRYDRNESTFGPDTISYNSVINAFQRSSIPNKGHKAEKLVQTMEEIFNRNENNLNTKHDQEVIKEPQQVEPDNVTYTSLIQCWAKSQSPHKAQKANSILLKQEKLYKNNKKQSLAPNIFMYDAVIRSCAFTKLDNDETRKEATRIAIETFMKMREQSSKGNQNVKMNSFVYTTFLMALSNLTKGKQFDALLRKTIDHCCEDGVVDNSILKYLQKGKSSLNVLRELISSNTSIRNVKLDNLTVNDLPQEWSRNSKKNIAHMTHSRQRKRQRFDGGRKRK